MRGGDAQERYVSLFRLHPSAARPAILYFHIETNSEEKKKRRKEEAKHFNTKITGGELYERINSTPSTPSPQRTTPDCCNYPTGLTNIY